MTNVRKISPWLLLVGVVVVGAVIAGLAWGIPRLTQRERVPVVAKTGEKKDVMDEPEEEPQDTRIPVKVVHPAQGQLERLSTQPGSIQSYESVRLFAKVPGFLVWQNVVTDQGERPLDIDDKVKRGQKLAVVDVPELQAQLKRNTAGVKQAKSRVSQMKARVLSARADLDAAKAAVTQAGAMAQSSAAWVRYWNKDLKRMEELLFLKSIDARVVDESKARFEASVETEISSKEAISTTKAKVVACEAKIEQALADVEEAQAEVEVAEAEVEKVRVQVDYATIYAPFDGVITQRQFLPGDYIRSANDTGNLPLLTVERTDLFRVIVQVPDRDVPFTDPGDPAYVLIDALPGRKLTAKVSRTAGKEDPQTRLMRVEIDLPNPTGKIKHGMYGQVTIVLDPEKDLLSIPSSCIVRRQEDGTATVFVVRDGHAHLVSVRLGADNGLRVGVLEGLTREDEVIRHPGANISDDTEVIPTVAD